MTTTLTKKDTPMKEAGHEKHCARRTKTYRPRFDVRETENELVLCGDLPGVSPDDLDIQFENRELTIRGSVQTSREDVSFLRHEYGIGGFHRSFSVAESIDVGNISAELKQGVLTIRLPKKEEVKPQRIRVTS